MSQCSAVQYSTAQHSTIKQLNSARFKFTSVLGLALAQFRPLQTSNTRTQPSPAQPRHGGEAGRRERGRGTTGSVVDQALHRDVKRWTGGLLLDAAIISRRRQGPGLTGQPE